MTDTLKRKTAVALAWSMIDRFGQQLLYFAVGIVVANILSVDDYALIGMFAIFTAIGNIVIESGFSAALIQKKDANDLDFSTVFWFNLGMSVAVYALLVACSPLIAAFLGEPRLLPLSAVVFLGIPLNATMLIQITQLTKQVRFKELAKANLLALLVAGIAALGMAFGGLGVWTLALQPVIQVAVKSLLLWHSSTWRPRRYFSWSVLGGFFRYSSSLLFSGLANTCFNNIYSLVIPRLYQARQLGFLTQANKIGDPIISLIHGSVQNATFPIYCDIQDERERLVNAYRKTIRFTAFVTFPCVVGLMVVAPALFRVLFKAEWWPAIPFFQLLCLGGCATVFTVVNGNFIKVSGQTRGILVTELLKIALSAVAIVLLCGHHVLWLVAAMVAIRYVVQLVYMLYTQRLSGYTVWQQTLDALPYLLIALLMGALLWGLGRVFTGSNVLLLAAQVVLGVAIYATVVFATGSKIMKEAISLLRGKPIV